MMRDTKAKVYLEDPVSTTGVIWYIVGRDSHNLIYVDVIDRKRVAGVIILRYRLSGSSQNGYTLQLVRQIGDPDFYVSPEDPYLREALSAALNYIMNEN